MLINGQLVKARSEEVMESYNPATEVKLGSAPLAGEQDVDDAIRGATMAFKLWKQETIGNRSKILRELAHGIRERAEEIAQWESMDCGNTIQRVRKDVQNCVRNLELYAGLGYELTGKTVPATHDNLHMTVREPYGVCARIVPF